MTDLVLIARRRTQVDSRTHYPGCEREHTECLIQRMADEIERRDEWREWATAEIERLHADNQAAVVAYAAEINEAKAEIERLRADAERYRWLKVNIPIILSDVPGDIEIEKLDAAIDAAMKKENGE